MGIVGLLGAYFLALRATKASNRAFKPNLVAKNITPTKVPSWNDSKDKLSN